jgi:uncharacterized glyoxalase superfamily protein PhnB
MEFYRDTLGGTLLYYDEPRKGWDGFFMVQMGPAIVMVGNFAANLEGEHAVSPERRAYLQNNKWGVGMTPFFKDVVNDIDAFYIELKKKGVTVAEPIHTTSYGWRMFGVEDPDGYVLMFANQVRENSSNG